jgi:hypothetical protein
MKQYEAIGTGGTRIIAAETKEDAAAEYAYISDGESADFCYLNKGGLVGVRDEGGLEIYEVNGRMERFYIPIPKLSLRA